MAATRPYTIIDADTHVTEAADLWTSRVPARLKDRVPRVEWDEEKQEQAWYIGDQWINSVGITAVAGWKDPYPGPPADLRRGPPRLLRRQGPPRLHGRARDLGDGAVPERRRLRQPGFRAPRRQRGQARLRTGLQRLPDRLVVGRPSAAHPGHDPALLGRGRRGRRDPALCARRAIAACSSPASRRASASRCSPIGTGTRSGPPRRTATCR